MTTTDTTDTVLDPQTLYLAGDRIVCGTLRCAGMRAMYEAATLDNHPVTAVTGTDIRQWCALDLGPMRCECGRLEHTTSVNAAQR